MGNVSTCLWFDGQAEEAARFYTSVVKNSRVGDVVLYGEAGPGEKGSVMIVTFELDGQQFIGLNRGPEFKFGEAISIHITCDSQQEIDELSQRLTVDGGEEGPCGWVKDKYGLSWQIDSRALHEMITSPDQEGATRAIKAMLGMKKLDVQALQDAFDGQA
jgi:predicted 3-demethylubiquinone-9 3-methyltransferase (glyoxalase superfamily)